MISTALRNSSSEPKDPNGNLTNPFDDAFTATVIPLESTVYLPISSALKSTL